MIINGKDYRIVFLASFRQAIYIYHMEYIHRK